MIVSITYSLSQSVSQNKVPLIDYLVSMFTNQQLLLKKNQIKQEKNNKRKLEEEEGNNSDGNSQDTSKIWNIYIYVQSEDAFYSGCWNISHQH